MVLAFVERSNFYAHAGVSDIFYRKKKKKKKMSEEELDLEHLHMPRWLKFVLFLVIGGLVLFLIFPLITMLIAIAGMFKGVVNVAAKLLNWLDKHMGILIALVVTIGSFRMIPSIIDAAIACRKQANEFKEEGLRSLLIKAEAQGVREGVQNATGNVSDEERKKQQEERQNVLNELDKIQDHTTKDAAKAAIQKVWDAGKVEGE